MKITSVAVLGAGAVGSYVIWGLSNREDIKLGVIAEGERKERLKHQGCAINGNIYHPEVWAPEEAENMDFLIVSLKYGALPGALEDIGKIVGKDTIVMSLMNGVDSEDIIAEQIGKKVEVKMMLQQDAGITQTRLVNVSVEEKIRQQVHFDNIEIED